MNKIRIDNRNMKHLSRRDRKRLSEELGYEIKEKTIFEVNLGKVTLYLFGENKVPKLARYKGKLIPTFYYSELVNSLPRVIVDKGAAEALKRGANLMAPGVKHRPSGVKPGDLVLVVDEDGNPVGIGEARVENLPERGVVVLMYHVISPNDAISNAIKLRKERHI